SAGYFGAYHSGAPKEHAEALRTIGGAIGMVFQIVDDIIDIFSESHESGKTPGTDLREGVFTLPVLYALEEDSEAGAALRELLTGPLEADEDVNRALELLRASNGRQRAVEVVKHYLHVVTTECEAWPDSPAARALRSLASYTVARVG